MHYIITGKTYNGKFIEQHHDDIQVLSTEALASSDIRFGIKDKLYVPSETALSTVLDKLDDLDAKRGILMLKDKYKCREALSDMYPDFYFRKCGILDLFEMDPPHKKIAIKPQRGFFGTGVRFADIDSDMTAIAEQVTNDIKSNGRFFPESVLSTQDILLEEYVEGEEYAVDMFYDSNGNAEIMNIYHHPEPAIKEYAHLMYYSNKELFDRYLEEFTILFKELGKHMNLVNFPIHAEFKRSHERFIPIEFNPMRYGGFGLADLGFLSYEKQAISCYFQNSHVDWQQIWNSRQERNYAFVLAYNGKDVDISTQKPLHKSFRQHLNRYASVMDYVQLDHQSNPVFAIAYVQTDDYQQLMELLNTDFNDFFI